MKILLLDNYDSFTYNLVHLVEKVSPYTVEVFRNDKIELNAIAQYDKIILSPGPGLPSESGILMDILKNYASTKSILGVCLGHQAIAQSFGAELINMNEVFHGVAMSIKIIKEDYLFHNMPTHFNVGRYHSWTVSNKRLSENMEILALDNENNIMAIRHQKMDVRGIQFHPESILTEHGEALMSNWINH